MTKGRGGPAGFGGDSKPATNIKITLYKNGYVLDDNTDEFKTYDTPEGKQFLAELSAGKVPTILRSKYPNGLDVGLEDKR